MKIKRCDNCGRFNPPIFDNNPRLCAVCATPDGFYDAVNSYIPMKANGKINYWKLQFPFTFNWRGWWKL